MYYTKANYTFPSGNKQIHGQRGEVTGPEKPDSDGDERISVLFPGNKGSVPCLLTEVRRLHAASASPPARHRRRPHLPAHAPPPLHRPGAPTPRGKRRRAPRGRTPRAGAVVAACVVRGCGRGAEPHPCTAVAGARR